MSQNAVVIGALRVKENAVTLHIVPQCVYNHLPLMLSPYIFIISFLYLDLYFLGDNQWIK